MIHSRQRHTVSKWCILHSIVVTIISAMCQSISVYSFNCRISLPSDAKFLKRLFNITCDNNAYPRRFHSVSGVRKVIRDTCVHCLFFLCPQVYTSTCSINSHLAFGTHGSIEQVSSNLCCAKIRLQGLRTDQRHANGVRIHRLNLPESLGDLKIAAPLFYKAYTHGTAWHIGQIAHHRGQRNAATPSHIFTVFNQSHTIVYSLVMSAAHIVRAYIPWESHHWTLLPKAPMINYVSKCFGVDLSLVRDQYEKKSIAAMALSTLQSTN